MPCVAVVVVGVTGAIFRRPLSLPPSVTLFECMRKCSWKQSHYYGALSNYNFKCITNDQKCADVLWNDPIPCAKYCAHSATITHWKSYNIRQLLAKKQHRNNRFLSVRIWMEQSSFSVYVCVCDKIGTEWINSNSAGARYQQYRIRSYFRYSLEIPAEIEWVSAFSRTICQNGIPRRLKSAPTENGWKELQPVFLLLHQPWRFFCLVPCCDKWLLFPLLFWSKFFPATAIHSPNMEPCEKVSIC